MITIDFKELRRLLLPSPLRHAKLLNGFIDALFVPLKALYNRQRDYEETVAIRLPNDGIRTDQIKNSVALILGIDPSLVEVTNKLWAPVPRNLYIDDDPRQQPPRAFGTAFDITSDSTHNNIVNHQLIGNTNFIWSHERQSPPKAFEVILPTGLTAADINKVRQHLDSFKPPSTTYTIWDRNSYQY